MDTSATKLLKSLKANEIADRLENLDAEAKALRVLLRAARQRDRQLRDSSRGGKGGSQ